MTFRTISAALVAMTCVAGCSVLTDFTGLTGSTPDPGAIEAGVDASSDASSEGGPADSAPVTDTGSDAPPVDAGAWAYVGSIAKSVDPGPITLTAGQTVLAGDLVVISCDSGSNSTTLSLSGFSATALTLKSQMVPGPSYEAVIFWGIAQQRIDTLTVTATAAVPGQFIDCYISTYRGGTAATLVDHTAASGTGPGLVTCHPVTTVRGGVAVYMAARSTCAGSPVLPFIQLQSVNGNPTGNLVPTDGTMAGTQLSDCNSSTGDWVCLLISLSP